MNRLYHSLSKTNDGAFVIDGRHRIVFWNKAAERILGFTAEEVAGRSCYEILGGRDEEGRTLCRRYCQVAIMAERGDTLPNRDVFVPDHTGEGRWLNVTTFTYTGVDKGVGQVIVHLFRNVTEMKNYQRFADSVLAASEHLQQDGDHQTFSLFQLSTPQKKPQRDGLTVRERQVLGLMAQGFGTSEIADSLTISPSTVRNHAQNIMDKLRVHSRLGVVAYAYQNGLIETSEL